MRETEEIKDGESREKRQKSAAQEIEEIGRGTNSARYYTVATR
jgi:hypothetical protein